MLEQGLAITLIGMGTVFSFLIILVFAMLGMEQVLAFINKIFPEKLPEVASPKKSNSRDESAEIAIAIAATKAF